MTERRTSKTFREYEAVSKRANDLYKEAEVLIGADERLFMEKLESCARLEEEAFRLSEYAGVGSLIRDAHARYAIQNYFRLGLYTDVVRFGEEAVLLLQDDPGSQKTDDQINLYVCTARDRIPVPQPLP